MRIHKPQSYEDRLVSLKLWQHRDNRRFNLDEFARAGFFFEQFFDIYDDPGRLRCAFCPAVVSNWQPGDDPWREHAVSVDYCPHVMQHKGEDFIERVKKEEEELADVTCYLDDLTIPEEENYDLKGEQTSFGLFGIPQTTMRREQRVTDNISSEHQSGVTPSSCRLQPGYGGTHRKSIIPDCNMDSKETRLASFGRVRHLIENDNLLNQLAKSGYYFEGIDEYGVRVRCYSCRSVLSDISDLGNVWTLHAQNCAYVIQRKGLDNLQDSVKDIQITGEIHETEPTLENQTKKRKQVECQENNLETDKNKRPCTQRSVQEHDASKTLSGGRRVQRFCSYKGRWCPIQWRPLVTPSYSRPWRGSHRDIRNTGAGIDSGGEIKDHKVVFLCCRRKVCRRNGGQGPCPCCLRDKFA